ncbi:MerR family DNA-binding transcriptional regulator [Actinoplanes utahensis]|uniref:Transcriptional regulator n=1 Tax=Actinoplanes utahensis TaxID=1869 RepID=A0A0A6UTR4_ACTUT|nr:MerR family DNA-binding transcriptional regulator [Actinoplanes utahensis]KHD78771.1 transcriptional regulator [Actinoplanes utahensis]GIF32136.1 hypothetical protein Aut01nite_51220 [Actinoplanes utahensis]
MTIPGTTTYTLTVGEVAAASGAAPSAVRFYEQHGVIQAVRTSGDQRRFSADAACRIRVAKVAQRVGLTVREIADVFADLPEDPEPGDWGRIADTLVREAEERMAALRAHLEQMRSGGRLCEM